MLFKHADWGFRLSPCVLSPLCLHRPPLPLSISSSIQTNRRKKAKNINSPSSTTVIEVAPEKARLSSHRRPWPRRGKFFFMRIFQNNSLAQDYHDILLSKQGRRRTTSFSSIPRTALELSSEWGHACMHAARSSRRTQTHQQDAVLLDSCLNSHSLSEGSLHKSLFSMFLFRPFLLSRPSVFPSSTVLHLFFSLSQQVSKSCLSSAGARQTALASTAMKLSPLDVFSPLPLAKEVLSHPRCFQACSL